MWRRLNFSNDSSSLFSDFFCGVGLDEKTNQTDDSTIKPVALEQSAVLYEVCFVFWGGVTVSLAAGG